MQYISVSQVNAEQKHVGKGTSFIKNTTPKWSLIYYSINALLKETVILHQTLFLFCFLYNAMSTEGMGALNIPGKYSFSSNEKAEKGKE